MESALRPRCWRGSWRQHRAGRSPGSGVVPGLRIPPAIVLPLILALKLTLFLVLFLVLTLAMTGCDRAPRGSGPLLQEAYVWQRDWNGAVTSAITTHGTAFGRWVVLGAEVVWKPGPPRVVRVAYDAGVVRVAGCPVGLALRVGPYGGPFERDDAAIRLLRDTAVDLVARARREGWEPAEVQLDFDCAESRLSGYRVWVEVLRREVAPVPLTVTALPSWLKRGTFPALVRAADGFVLQVHSLARPKSVGEPFVLCDPAAARKAVERAGRVGVPFRVALPTYGYLVAFGPDGAFAGASAEGPMPARPAGTQFRELSADPVAMAHLVADWSQDRPGAMSGLIWYRMPVAGDRLNWRWRTLESVMAGRAPRAVLSAAVSHPQPALGEIRLRNDGAADHSGPVTVRVQWSGAQRLGSDGIRGFSAGPAESGEMLFTHPTCRLPAGEAATIGWVRLDGEAIWSVELTPSTPVSTVVLP